MACGVSAYGPLDVDCPQTTTGNFSWALAGLGNCRIFFNEITLGHCAKASAVSLPSPNERHSHSIATTSCCQAATSKSEWLTIPRSGSNPIDPCVWENGPLPVVAVLRSIDGSACRAYGREASVTCDGGLIDRPTRTLVLQSYGQCAPVSGIRRFTSNRPAAEASTHEHLQRDLQLVGWQHLVQSYLYCPTWPPRRHGRGGQSLLCAVTRRGTARRSSTLGNLRKGGRSLPNTARLAWLDALLGRRTADCQAVSTAAVGEASSSQPDGNRRCLPTRWFDSGEWIEARRDG